ncbi:protein of unknown function [Burkholderia multivorans]
MPPGHDRFRRRPPLRAAARPLSALWPYLRLRRAQPAVRLLVRGDAGPARRRAARARRALPVPGMPRGRHRPARVGGAGLNG